MKFASAAVLLALVVISSAAPQFSGNTARVPQTLQRDEVRSENGEYTLRYVTENGITVTEVGRLVPNDEGTGFVLIKQGSSSYTSPEGRVISTAYEADRQGYRASGDHLPVAPVA